MQIVAAIQMCSTTILDENLAQAAVLIAEAADMGAKLVVLPEMFSSLGSGLATHIAYQENFGAGKIQDFLANMAQRYHVWIVGGTIPIRTHSSPGKIRAACLVYNDKGDVIARYDKIHLFDVVLSAQESYCESATVEPGAEIILVNTPVGKLGLGVCFDIRFPMLFSELTKKGVEIIAIPAAFTPQTGQAHWEILMRCRALDTQAYLIGAGQGGQHPSGRITHGHSMIVNPWGEILAQQKKPGPGVISAMVDLKKLHEIRQKLPIL